MLKCKEVVEITAKDEKLTLFKKVEFKMHLLMCKHCSAYVEQIKLIKAQYKKVFKKVTEVDEDHLKELENKIIEDIQKKIKSDK